MTTDRIAISWPLSDVHGWGVFGLNLTVELARSAPPAPMLLSEPSFMAFPERHRDVLEPLMAEQKALMATIEPLGREGRQAVINEIAVLHGLGDDFRGERVSDLVRGRANVGFIFFERWDFDDDALERARGFDRIVVGSRWNRDRLIALGLGDTAFVAQGIDPALFHPRDRKGTYGDRFVVYSGGKLEPRKGQDIALAAFRRFHESHPDSVLIANWHNPWPGRGFPPLPHAKAAPEVRDGTYDVAAWAVANGVPADAFVDLGWVPNARVADVLCEAHAALFANRCEGGTNLVAMEAMAMGVPCVLSANSGHLDLISGDNCYPLRDQAPSLLDGAAVSWRESSVDEAVAALETIHANREDARRRGALGAEYIAAWSWRAQTEKLLGAVADLL